MHTVGVFTKRNFEWYFRQGCSLVCGVGENTKRNFEWYFRQGCSLVCVLGENTKHGGNFFISLDFPLLGTKSFVPKKSAYLRTVLNTNPVFVRPGRRRFLNVREQNPFT